MFPTFDALPPHETVGARKARKEREENNAARRGSTSTTQSSTSSVKDTKPAGRSAFGFFKSKDKQVQEIPVQKKKLSQQPEPEPEPELDSNVPATTPPSDWGAALEVTHHDAHKRLVQQSFQPPPQPSYQDPPQRSHHEHHTPSPPESAYPSPPPSCALPPPPPSASGFNRSPARIDTRTSHNDVDRLRSQLAGVSLSPTTNAHDNDRIRSRASHISLSPSTASSSGRTAFSGRSVFSGADSVVSEESYADSPATNLQLEPVSLKQVDPRSESRQSDRSAKAAQGPFARAVAKMDNAGPRIISARLSEEWEGLDDDDSYQEILFEKRLWALSAYQRLTQNKHLQSPAHEVLSGSRPADQRRILHLHGSLADGWLLATRYPVATVYTTSSMTSFDSPTSYPAPLNHHSLYVPSLSSPMPFPDGYFDVIVSRSVSTVLRNDQWARFFFDCKRVLKAGGQLEILSVDAHLHSEGQKMSSWVDKHIVDRLEGHSLSKLPSDTVLDTMEIVNLENIRRARVALPTSLSAPKALKAAPSSQDIVDSSRMMAFLGRHFYQDLYGKMMRSQQGAEWFWSHPGVQEECERHQTKMVLTIACAQKPAASPSNDSYLDI